MEFSALLLNMWQFRRSNLELWHKGWSVVPADYTSNRAQHTVWFRHQEVNSKSLFQSLTLETTLPLIHGEQPVPLGSCCASAALGKAPPVYCEPILPDCARSAAGPSPSSLGAASSAKPWAASDHSDAPPTAKTKHRKIRKYKTESYH